MELSRCGIRAARVLAALQQGVWSAEERPVILPPMSDGTDLEALARRYLDLWQDQMTAMASDPEFAEALERLLAVAGMPGSDGSASAGNASAGNASGDGASPLTAWTAWPMAMLLTMAAMSRDAAQAGATPPDQPAAAQARGQDGQTAGTQAASGASDDGALDVDRLLRRLAVLEERVASLEAAGRADGSDGREDEARRRAGDAGKRSGGKSPARGDRKRRS